jgi:hypothetical protein
MSVARHHRDWLALVPASGPFLALEVLQEAFPQGLPQLPRETRQRLRLAWEEWNETPRDPKIHRAWIRMVYREALDWDPEILTDGQSIDGRLAVEVPEHRERLVPDRVLKSGGAPGQAHLLVTEWPRGTALDEALPHSAWASTPAERTVRLCRESGIPLGLATNGEHWSVVHAPEGGTVSQAEWYTELWFQEPRTLEAFVSLLEARRFFGMAEDESLDKLLERSAEHQAEVTDRLGEQVRTAVEVLIQALDRADIDTRGALLADVPERRLYDAAVTVMMRLVFLFHAEERGLLLLGDSVWDEFYSVALLRDQLRAEADRLGIEVLERRKDAWLRLLSVFRAVYGGARHETVSLPAYGGSLFDPDRFPFLEGREENTTWRRDAADPLPVDNRTVLHLLDSLQQIEGRRLSFEALDIEQIGHVYEGLLDHVAVRVTEPTVGLKGTKSKGDPEVALTRLEEALEKGRSGFVDLVSEQTGRSKSAIGNALDREADDETIRRLRVACDNDDALLRRVLPFHDLIRDDVWGFPVVYTGGSVIVTGGADRRETGTHYTPKSITEEMVRETLQPLVYDGQADGKAREEWRLRSPQAILDLNVCDPAMGSGAFLVQVCRWLGERLVEAWSEYETRNEPDGEHLLPESTEERLLLAKRLVAERCLYGVDVNPMAVELAKLSIWLVTLAKGRPFGFLDHAFRAGDSLFGVFHPDQIRHFHVDPDRGKQLHHTLFDFTKHVAPALEKALWLREELESLRVVDIRDVRQQEALNRRARTQLEKVEVVADLVVAAALAHAGNSDAPLDELMAELSREVDRTLSGEADAGSLRNLRGRGRTLLDEVERPEGKNLFPLHWPVAFPEVFSERKRGFDAILGNPPYMGGQKITGNFGTPYREYLVERIAGGARGSADLVAYFFLRAWQLLRPGGNFGLLAVNTIAEGDTRQVGLERLLEQGASIYSAFPDEPWPNRAAVVTSRVHVHRGEWSAKRYLKKREVPYVSAFFSDHEETTPETLATNEEIVFQGSIVLGMGFVIDDREEVDRMLDEDPRNAEVIFPYLTGKDLNSDPEQRPSRWVINFWDWPLDKAMTYRMPFQRVERLVKPEREKLRPTNTTNRNRRKFWWRYGSDAKTLYHAIGRGHCFAGHPPVRALTGRPLARVITFATQATKFPVFAWVGNEAMYSHSLAVFTSDHDGLFALLHSFIHTEWAWKHASKLESRLRYTPSDCFETFPLPEPERFNDLEPMGCSYHLRRQEIMTENRLGLTRFYNHLHNPRNGREAIREFLEIQEELDSAVIRAYGWNDLTLAHDFREVTYLPRNDSLRFAVSSGARREILHRLSKLNQARHERQLRTGADRKVREVVCRRKGLLPRTTTPLQDDSVQSLRGGRREILSNGKQEGLQQDILETTAEDIPADRTDEHSALENWFRTHPGWHARSDVLEDLQLSTTEWNTTIRHLVDVGIVERKGRKRGTRYRFASSTSADETEGTESE